jgi:hypothetical protein
MHPDQIVLLDQRRNTLRKSLVDPLIPLAELAFIFGQVDAVMKQWPQCRIGIAVVIFIRR